MVCLINFPLFDGCLEEYGGESGLTAFCSALQCDGLEFIWGGGGLPSQPPQGLAVGYHLTFYPDWLDFWRGDERALLRKFGSREAYVSYYGGEDGGCLLDKCRTDLERAAALGAKYVVVHVSNVSIEECYTYRWEHSDMEVIDAAADFINRLTAGMTLPFPILVENQWWPGFTFKDPAMTARLLSLIRCPKKGIMLDTGHLMNTDLFLMSEAQGVRYIHRMLDRHGELAKWIRGIHLHQSLSGAYVQENIGRLPAGLPRDFLPRFGESYSHILRIDRHRPWTEPRIRSVIERIQPDFLTHELYAVNRAEREGAVRRQTQTLRRGCHTVMQ